MEEVAEQKVLEEMRKRLKSKLLFTRVDEELYSELVRWADKKKCRTLSEAIRRILIEYLEKSREPSVVTSMRRLDAIINEVREFYEITPRELEKIIMKYAGADQRTIRKYVDLLIKMGVLKQTAKGIFRVVREGEEPETIDEEKLSKIVNELESLKAQGREKITKRELEAIIAKHVGNEEIERYIDVLIERKLLRR